MGGALFFFGVGMVLWAKKLMPHEVATQGRHGGASEPVDAQTAGATIMAGFERTGLARHKMVRRSLFGAGGALGLLAVVPLGGLIKNPGRGDELAKTSWADGIRLVRDDGTPIRPADMLPGSLETVFPAVEGGNRQADAATMLIRLRREQVDELRLPPGRESFVYQDFIAYSKICTHAGCPVSLYEQETGRILCPCHQSQFVVTLGAIPIFGPAARPLPQLPIELDDEGFFVARDDYAEPVGPSFWEREKVEEG
jgi:ubiquinol-cytochrome c reductase iron-sulfur subunit